jgi:hypothetical protein
MAARFTGGGNSSAWPSRRRYWMAPEGQACAMSTSRSTGMVSGWIHGPFTLARNTVGAPVTQKRAWMQRTPW